METRPEKVEKVRAFIAVHPDPSTLAQLQKMQAELRSQIRDGVRWAKPEQLHLTLQFLSYIEAARVEAYIAAIGRVAEQQAPFRLRSEGLGCFPTSKRPRVIWAGLHGDIQELQKLKSELDQVLAELGYVPETRPFHPHITFGRVNELSRRDAETLQQWLTAAGQTQFGAWQVNSVDLMRSVLSPKGPTYSTLAAVVLGR